MTGPLRLTVVQLRGDDRWNSVAVIDGRDYPDRESYDRVVHAAFELLDDLDIPAQLETELIRADEPPSRLPSWADYVTQQRW
ncbi:hypothetical protein HPO96_19685 [Kribbella sandramycini]|uniref:Uncharacterized protein n=1 Tax=Kribbella sandramycini TaxID=60450 RepID=A0A7Y4L197_9ACTN|nr:hypothetical protein [Kribbella sandramycini]MBB6564771.1 hypothetical protein [Kribbella sandramycini]NOL42472.1 hypothetical protein [Kribbella sandramycini]